MNIPVKISLSVLMCFLFIQPVMAQKLSQGQVLRWITDWMHDPARGAGRTPSMEDITGFPFTETRLLGTGRYRRDRGQAHLAIFPSPDAFWLALKKFAHSEGLSVSLLNLRLRKPSQPMLEALRTEAKHLVLDWIEGPGQGRMPRPEDFEHIPISYDRVISAGDYAPGKPQGENGLFQGLQELCLVVRADAKARGFKPRLLGLKFQPPVLDTLQTALQEEALELILEWVVQHQGRLPESEDFNELPFGYERLTSPTLGLFPDIQTFWIRFKDFASQKGVAVRLLDVQFRNSLSNELRAVLQQEALQIVADWVRRHKRLLEEREFGIHSLPVSYERLTSTGHYLPNLRGADTSLFESAQSFWRAFKESAPDLQIRLLDVVFRAELDGQTRRLLRQEALEMIMTWAQARGRFPLVSDFGSEELPVSYERLVSLSRYSHVRGDTLSRTGLFRNAAEFRRCLAEFATARGLWIPSKHKTTPAARMQPVAARITRTRPKALKSPKNAKAKEMEPQALVKIEKPVEKAENVQLLPPGALRRKKIVHNAGPKQIFPLAQRALQDEACGMILEWIKAPQNRRYPRRSDFGYKLKQIRIAYDRLIGAGEYAGALAYQALFSSEEEFAKRLVAFAATQKTPLKLLYFPFETEISAETRARIQHEALEVVIEGMQPLPSPLPAAGSFSSSGGPIPLHYGRLIGQHKRRIFDSREQFEAALTRRLEAARQARCEAVL